MSTDKLVILVTGSIVSGKTSFLERLRRTTEKWWRVCGFISPASHGREPRSGQPAASYHLAVIGSSALLPWATRRPGASGFEFCASSCAQTQAMVGSQLARGDADICFLDEIGRLELAGQGFGELFHLALASPCRVVVAAVKRSLLADLIERFGILDPVIIDLDTHDAKQGMRHARRKIAACDAERIGALAGIGGLLEVGLGSTLHAYRVPFKGHLLAYLQNLLLIAFGKALHGRGLVRISFISAMLKAFSPVGSALRPMAYIFLQGVAFAAPISVLGWGLGSVLLGSVLMAWLTLILALAMSYALFGESLFMALAQAITFASAWFGLESPSLFFVVAGAFVLKAMLALGLALGAYFGNLQPFMHWLNRRDARGRAHHLPGRRPDTDRCSVGNTAVAALGDLIRPRFVIAFLMSALLLLFFAGLSTQDFMNLVVRGLCISYLGFVAVRRIDVQALGRWLDRRSHLGMARSLPVALDMLGRSPPAPPGAGLGQTPCNDRP